MSIYSPVGKPTGLRLLDADARRLSSTYGELYADREAEAHLFLIIDVTSTSGVPHSRWYFSTRAAFFVVGPPLLSFLTASLLLESAHLTRERVRFVDNDCQFDEGRFDHAMREAQYIRIFEQLHQALKSDPYDLGTLRTGSALVRLGDTFASSPLAFVGSMTFFSYPLDPTCALPTLCTSLAGIEKACARVFSFPREVSLSSHLLFFLIK